ncbi:MAG: hypothetical protein Q7P63_01350 [Verrucomicrobiota bacterium JB022]|nr:hypothetical protein [Verrucomicrobiota bacterium JB022]
MKPLLYALTAGILGLALGYFTSGVLPQEVASDLIKTLGNITAIAGGLLGWSVSFLGQSRTALKDHVTRAAIDTASKLAKKHLEIIDFWAFALCAALLSITLSVFLPAIQRNTDSYTTVYSVAVSLLFVSLYYVLLLFLNTRSLARLKNDLDELSHREAIRKHNLDGVQE